MPLKLTQEKNCLYQSARAWSIKNTSQLLLQIAKILRSVDNFPQLTFERQVVGKIDVSVAVLETLEKWSRLRLKREWNLLRKGLSKN